MTNDSVGVDLQILHQAASGRPLRPEWDCGRASIVVRKDTDLLFRGCGAEIRDFDQVFPLILGQ
jgi:hypothetical protein